MGIKEPPSKECSFLLFLLAFMNKLTTSKYIAKGTTECYREIKVNNINQNLTTAYFVFICFKTTTFFHISKKITIPKLCYLVLDPQKMKDFLNYTTQYQNSYS